MFTKNSTAKPSNTTQPLSWSPPPHPAYYPRCNSAIWTHTHTPTHLYSDTQLTERRWGIHLHRFLHYLLSTNQPPHIPSIIIISQDYRCLR